MRSGLTSAEAEARLHEIGPNSVTTPRPRGLAVFLRKLWGPVPWMLGASAILELILGRYTQAIIIISLLLFNAALGYIQESRARNALDLLQQKLAISVRTRRDGAWQIIPSRSVVPGDLIHLRVGDFIPADVTLVDGHLAIDQSALTGESLPIEAEAGATVWTGGVVQRGEANGEVTATGPRTLYGKTAELVHAARTTSQLESTIFGIVRYLIAFDAVLAIGVVLYAIALDLPPASSLSFALILLIASVPASLPTTAVLASAVGAQQLASRGVLVTRLTTLEEAAAMDVLCSDKTGTITKNQLSLATTLAFGPYDEADVLKLAAICSDEASQDPIDMAIIRAARERGAMVDAERLEFIPFDPLLKRTEAFARVDGRTIHIAKGYPESVGTLAAESAEFIQNVIALSKQGYRVIAVAAGSVAAGSVAAGSVAAGSGAAEGAEAAQDGGMAMAGLVGLYDPPRDDSRAVIQALKDLAVRVVMVTGDGLTTARAIAARVGVEGEACNADELRRRMGDSDLPYNIIAEVLPEDKFEIVRHFQTRGHVVGMTGDGVNDAPALKQAQVGIAVSNATDVARAAAGAVLVNPGLIDMLAAVKIGRQIHQRMLTYTLNKIVKTFQIALFLSISLFLTGEFVITTKLIVMLLFTNDFVSMSLASDRVAHSPTPERWRIRPLMAGALLLAVAWLGLSFVTLFMGRAVYRLNLAELQTLIFVMLVFTGQANVYLVRERRAFWKSRPSPALLLSTIGDVVIVSALAVWGILMTPISLSIVAGMLGMTALFALGLDWFKVRVFRRVGFNA